MASSNKLVYLLELQSNLGRKAGEELKAYERASAGAEGKTKDFSGTVDRTAGVKHG